MIATLVGLLVIAAVMCAPSTVAAQTATTMRATVAASQFYESNLFATPASLGPQGDLVSRVGPSFEAIYVSLPFEVVGRYQIQADRYRTHPELTSTAAHQDASVSMKYAPQPRIDLSLDAGYIRTQTPSELNLDSQLATVRAPAERAAMTAIAAYNWTKVTTISGEYTFNHDAMIGGLSSVMHRGRFAVEWSASTRSTYQINYQLRDVTFDADATMRSSVVTAGWRHSVTPRTDFEIAAGPRIAQGAVRPELLATMQYRLSKIQLSLGYARTDLTVIGERGLIDLQRVSLTGSVSPTQRLSVTARPSFTQSARGRDRIPVYALDIESSFEITRRVSLMGWGRIGRQRGTLSGSPDIIPYQRLGFDVKITVPRRAVDATRRRSA